MLPAAHLPGNLSTEGAWALALSEAQRTAGWLPLHASLAAREGRALAVSGPSGAGKSTAALRLLGLGYDILAEDQAWIRGQDVVCSGLDASLRVFPDSLERFALAQKGRADGPDVMGKLYLPLPHAGSAAVLTQLLLLSPDASGPLTRAAQVRGLWEASG